MAAPKALSLGGAGATTTIDDLVNVASRFVPLQLDTAALDRVKKESPNPKTFKPEDVQQANNTANGVSSAHNFLSFEQCRAVVFVLLNRFINGSKTEIRAQVLQYLADLLNKPAAPAMPREATDASALSVVCDALHGMGECWTSNGVVTTENCIGSQDGASVPHISEKERTLLCSGFVASAGVAGLVVAAARQVSLVATPIAALTCEALQAQVTCFDADVIEAAQHASLIAVADDLRSVLEGSKLINARKGGVGLLDAIAALPQDHSDVADAIAALYTNFRAELLTAAVPLGKNNTPQAVTRKGLLRTSVALAQSLATAAENSVSRCRCLLQTATASGAASDKLAACIQADVDGANAALQQATNATTANASQPQGVQACLAADAVLRAWQSALAIEASLAVLLLRHLEGPAAAASAADKEVASNEDSKKKDKKKDKNKGGFGMGRGTAMMRAWLEQSAAHSLHAGSDADNAAATLDLTAVNEENWPAILRAVQQELSPQHAALAAKMNELRQLIESNQARRKPKIPKGTRDFLPDQMSIRQLAFSKIEAVFKRHGAVTIDTPVFELRETLMGKYGEDSKLIYDLADQGGEILSLRYDLTVPFARYVALNGIGNIKRYHIGKVYRRDQPAMNRGRFREFFQCDFDIAGSYPTMVADAEVLRVLVEILDDLKLGKYTVKLNHRKILDAMMAVCGVPSQKFRTICSAIDKLDKEPWDAVRTEMVNEKGLPADVADRIGTFVDLKGDPRKVLAALQHADNALSSHPESKQALQDLAVLFDFLDCMGALGPISFDLSLARGLDYYTGVIYEAVLEGAHVGSIAAGGRYDGLIGMFSGKDIPAVGVSIGIERVSAIVEQQMRERAEQRSVQIRGCETQVLVASIGKGLQKERMRICSELWQAGIKAEFVYKADPKMGDNFTYAFDNGIPFLILFGDDELQQGVVKIKDLAVDKDSDGTAVARSELVNELLKRMQEKGDAFASLLQ